MGLGKKQKYAEIQTKNFLFWHDCQLASVIERFFFSTLRFFNRSPSSLAFNSLFLAKMRHFVRFKQESLRGKFYERNRLCNLLGFCIACCIVDSSHAGTVPSYNLLSAKARSLSCTPSSPMKLLLTQSHALSMPEGTRGVIL